MSPCIKHIRLWTLRIPLPRTVYLGRLRIEHREFAVAQIELDSGLTGWGATLTRGKPVEAAAQQLFVPIVSGRELTPDDRLWDRMMRAVSNAESRGGVMRALSILDIALWDLRAKLAEMPLSKMLGGNAESVDVLVVGGYRREGDAPDAMLIEVDFYRSQNVGKLKLMWTPEEMVSHAGLFVEARQQIGEDALFGNDFTGNGKNVTTVANALECVKEASLDFIEDPFAPAEISNYRELRTQVDCRIMTGETIDNFSEAEDLLAARVIDTARWDATVCGGVTGWLKLQKLSAAHGLSVSPHVFPEIHAPLAIGTNQPFVEATIAPYDTMNFSAVIDRPLTLHDGRFLGSDRPGLGVEFVPEKAQPFIVNGGGGGIT